MDTIYKYPIEITDEQTLSIPAAFDPLHVGLDPNGAPCLWCAVDSNRIKRDVKVAVVGTGNHLPQDVKRHVGSFVQGPFVWHVFLC
jgi:hypothetical protein